MACSTLVDSGHFSEDAIERQMSHQERNSVRAAYTHKAKLIHERVQIMQWWSDYLDASKSGYIEPYLFAIEKNQAYTLFCQLRMTYHSRGDFTAGIRVQDTQ